MDYFTISVGAIIVFYGLYTLSIRILHPQRLIKLKAMKEKFGKSVGITIHVIAYTVMPIIFGFIVIIAGSQGISLAKLFLS